MEQAGTTWNELKPPGHHVEQIETTWNNNKKKKEIHIRLLYPSLLYIYFEQKKHNNFQRKYGSCQATKTTFEIFRRKLLKQNIDTCVKIPLGDFQIN